MIHIFQNECAAIFASDFWFCPNYKRKPRSTRKHIRALKAQDRRLGIVRTYDSKARGVAIASLRKA